MKIIDKINNSISEDRCGWSFEYFPPKTPQGVQNLYDRMERMQTLGPEFVDVTWGAGGSTSDLTIEICKTAQSVYGLETCMHLTCTNMDRSKIDSALLVARNAGIHNILALRGDPPRGQTEWTHCDNGFKNAVDLVRYIRQTHGEFFCISVAGYPEGHIDNPDRRQDMLYLKEKIDAGADYIVTQLFYDVDLFVQWLIELKEVGITCPVVPGIMPIQSYNGFKKMTTLCKTIVPDYIHRDLDPIKDDDQKVKEYGVKLAVSMCRVLRDHGIRNFHFYTLNLEKSIRLILEGLQFEPNVEVVKKLPWQCSLAKNRSNETVRPAHWRNRIKSYVRRTESWDDFPNGRWGDSRSPAYGELDGYGISIKYTTDEALKLWNTPTSVDDVNDLFAKFCTGEIKALPWSDQPLALESGAIMDSLLRLNHAGYLTINSQPAVNGVRSDDPIFGWGPRNGFVFQKGYLEVFVSPSVIDDLLKAMEGFPTLTYYAVDRSGTLLTNSSIDEPNAVTWGVFPGKEITQPTIVELASFMAWKDEAFEIWREWAQIFPQDSASVALLNSIADSYYLVNMVENDFINGDVFRVFDCLIDADNSKAS